MRFALLLPLLALAAPVHAGDNAPYYGPAKAWAGIGYKFGYKDEFRPDGTWRVVATTRSGDPTDMAMYRMAERARDAGYRYIEFLGGRTGRSPGYNSTTLDGRPSSTGAPPAACSRNDAKTCYTASVAEVMRQFGGVAGVQPGVAIPDATDRFGRQVYYSSYGKGAVAPAPTPPIATALAARRPVPARAPVATGNTRAMPTDFDKALKDNTPVRGRNVQLGWTISD